MKTTCAKIYHIKQDNFISHVAKCARISYGNTSYESTPYDANLINRLRHDGHLNVFRHGTVYYVIPTNNYKDIRRYVLDLCNAAKYSMHVVNVVRDSKFIYIAMNGQYYLEHIHDAELLTMHKYMVTTDEFAVYPNNKPIRRYTFAVTTEISTSRELNRVSPNNITEMSTRYCNFSKDKYVNEITFMDSASHNKISKFAKFIIKLMYKIDEIGYMLLTKYCKLTAQEAREVLPLGTRTEVVYTYTYEEWQHILDLRLHGTTGAPHPNAKIIAEYINNALNK